MAAGISDGVDFISTTSAASSATSAPAPMAIPMSARVRAGASLMPSPTMATFPYSCRRRITASLSPGSTSEITPSTPMRSAMAPAERRLSPVRSRTRMPT